MELKQLTEETFKIFDVWEDKFRWRGVIHSEKVNNIINFYYKFNNCI